MKKFALVSLLGVLLLLPGMAVSAFAASAQVTTPSLQRNATAASHMHGRRGWYTGGHGYYGAPQVNNQYFHGNSNVGVTVRAKGHDIDNSANSGWNRHYIQDNGTNGGNQMINQREPSGYRINNQHYWGNGNVDNTLIVQGSNMINTGNEGVNDGVIQDNTTNGANQMIN